MQQATGLGGRSVRYEFKRVSLRARTLRVRVAPCDRALTASDIVARAARALLRQEDQEVILVFLVDGALNVVAVHEVARGTVDQCFVHPRDVFRAAVLYGAAGVIMAHNHPSGCGSPSIGDARSTEAMAAAGRTLGIALVDHVIVTRRADHYSFARDSDLLHGSRDAACSGYAELEQSAGAA